VNAARAAFSLPPLAHTFEQNDRAARVLVLSSEAFDFPGPPFPPNVRFVGAQLDDPTWAAPWVSPFDPVDARPLILVGLSSTFQNQLPVLQRIADALAALPVRALITTGPALAGQKLSAAEHVRVVESAPHGHPAARAGRRLALWTRDHAQSARARSAPAVHADGARPGGQRRAGRLASRGCAPEADGASRGDQDGAGAVADRRSAFRRRTRARDAPSARSRA
jgi:hypothetical protein